MKGRAILAAATGVCLAVTLAACGSSSTSASSSSKVTTLTYWSGFTGGDRGTYESLIAEFNKTHPNIQVKMDEQPWDSLAQKLPTALASGSGPDIATPDYNVGTIRQYITNGLAAPLDDLIGSGTDQIPAGTMPKTITDAFTVNGHLYAAPANFATLMLYYNKDMLAAASLTPPTTMQELRDDAVKLTRRARPTASRWPTTTPSRCGRS